MRLKLFILTLLLPLVLFAEDIDYGCKVNTWKYEATIHKNNVWDVKETLNVTFLEERHGIYRYIPRHFTIANTVNGDIAEYNYLDVIDNVEVEGYTYELSDNGDSQDNLVIQIGDEDETIRGQHTYVITYQITVPDDRNNMSDYIYVSPLGTDWRSAIDKFEFVLHFEKTLPQNTAQAMRVFSGPWGNNSNDLNIDVNVEDKTISGSAANIEPFNGITLRAELKDGYWEGAYTQSNISMYIFLSLTALFFIIIAYYFLNNRRRKPLTVIEYSAPDGISSAEVGVIIDNSADLSDLTSLIVWFASKGYLKIREIPGEKHIFKKDEIDIELTKLKELPKDAPKYQKTFWKVFFKKDKKCLLSELGDQHTLINEALQSLQNEFKGKRSLQSTHYKSLLAVFAFFICGVGFFNATSSVATMDEDMLIFALAFWAGPAIFCAIMRLIASNYDMIASTFKRWIQYIAIIFFGLVNILILTCFYNEYDSFASFDMMMYVVIAGWLVALFAARINHDSKYRLEKMSLLLGFREFIDKSEIPMLKSQVDENPSFFFDILPYAMVFNLTDKWVKKFKEIDIQNPDWYEGSNALTSYMLADHLCHAVSRQISDSISVSSHDPSSSSGGGGGFSGGGVGGGGGGSW